MSFSLFFYLGKIQFWNRTTWWLSVWWCVKAWDAWVWWSTLYSLNKWFLFMKWRWLCHMLYSAAWQLMRRSLWFVTATWIVTMYISLRWQGPLLILDYFCPRRTLSNHVFLRKNWPLSLHMRRLSRNLLKIIWSLTTPMWALLEIS